MSLGLWAGGVAFRTKGHTQTLPDVTATLAIGHPRVSLAGRYPYPWRFRFGEPPGPSTARRGRWSLDQIAEFTAGALWTYVNAPLLAFLVGVTVEVPPRGQADPTGPRHTAARGRARP